MDTKVGQLFYEIVAKFDNNFTTNIKASETNVKKLGSEMAESEKKAKSFKATLSSFAQGLGLAFLAKLVFDFGKASVQAFANAQQSLLQFNNAQQNVAGSTKEQIESLNEYINLLEKKTTIDDKSIRQAAQILAQDQISIENQKKLLGGIVDLAVANAKASGQEIDVAGTGKAIGLAFAEGSLGRLVKQNVAGITEAQKKLFEFGTEAERTAILVQILDENAKGAGDTLAGSFQGKINAAKDTIEYFQVALGEGLAVAFPILADGLANTTSQLELTNEGSVTLGSTFVKLAGFTAFLINFIKLLGQGFISFLKIVGNGALIAMAFQKDVSGSFKRVGDSILSIGTAFVSLLSGDFDKAKEALKKGFDFSEVFNNSRQAVLALDASMIKSQEGIKATILAMGENLSTVADSKEVYKEAKTALDEITKAEDSKKEATERAREATEEEKKATEEAKKKLQDFNKTLVETIQASQKTSKELNENLTKSFKDFSKSISDNLQETKERLAEIVVDAEEKKKELLAKNDRTTQDEEELKKAEAILQARVGFEERSAKQIEAVKTRLKDAGLDPNAITIDPKQKTLEDELKQARTNATLDEFTLFENAQNERLILLTNSFITETLLLKSKIDTQKNYEDELTAFLISENSKRLADIEVFAEASIAKYGQMAESLRNLISLQRQAGQLTASGGNLPQFSAGGFVGSAGGEVHAGEFVVPANIVASNPELINLLDKARNQTNNITINTQQTGGDLKSASEELLWRLGRI